MASGTLPNSQSLVQLAIRKVAAIASLPEVTARIIQTIENPQSSASQLHGIVSHDPALTTRILKVVNSAFYGMPGQVGSIERAIVLLGFNTVKSLALAASLGQLFRGVTLCEGFTARDLWKHCICVGVGARELARQMKLPTVEEAFLAGIIHDLGLLISLQMWPERVRAACERAKAGEDFCLIEREVVGVDHMQMGAAVAEQWRFPKVCQQVAGFHHRPKLATADAKLMVTLVYVADTLCCQQERGFNLTALRQRVEEAGLAEVRIDPVLITRMAEKMDDLVAAASSLLEVRGSK